MPRAKFKVGDKVVERGSNLVGVVLYPPEIVLGNPASRNHYKVATTIRYYVAWPGLSHASSSIDEHKLQLAMVPPTIGRWVAGGGKYEARGVRYTYSIGGLVFFIEDARLVDPRFAPATRETLAKYPYSLMMAHEGTFAGMKRIGLFKKPTDAAKAASEWYADRITEMEPRLSSLIR
jgi:hypothetical protein